MQIFSSALSKLQIIARNSDWFITLFAAVVIGRSDYFGIGFSTVICKPLYVCQSSMDCVSLPHTAIIDFQFMLVYISHFVVFEVYNQHNSRIALHGQR